jgi:hypothetical protein
MRAQTLPAAAGWRWLMAGFAIFRRNPPMLSMLVIAYWFAILLLNVLPFVGSLAASLAIPGLSVGLMQAARNIQNGQPATVQTLLSGLKQNPRTLCLLGGLYLLCTMAALGLSALADGGALFTVMLNGKEEAREAVDVADLLLPMLIVMGLLTPVLMAYWFAPVLAAWHQLSVGKSLFFSFIACWLNWRAFLAYSLALLLVAGLLPGLLLGLLLMLFPAAQGLATAMITVPMVMIVAPSVFASFYVSYRDIFGISEIV